MGLEVFSGDQLQSTLEVVFELPAKDMKAMYRSGLQVYSKNLIKLLLGKAAVARQTDTLGIYSIIQR
jgi:hypothetical protein